MSRAHDLALALALVLWRAWAHSALTTTARCPFCCAFCHQTPSTFCHYRYNNTCSADSLPAQRRSFARAAARCLPLARSAVVAPPWRSWDTAATPPRARRLVASARCSPRRLPRCASVAPGAPIWLHLWSLAGHARTVRACPFRAAVGVCHVLGGQGRGAFSTAAARAH